ncbi:MAG: PVC-type heme-binding CxxCH protein [Pirellulales bacterium]
MTANGSALIALGLLAVGYWGLPAPASADDFIPRTQTAPPGPPVGAEEAARKMTVPAGFSVEVVAAEPQLVNPCAMTIDERGRFWVCESVEYPRKSAGEGQDRIKILEDTNGDGRADKVTVFAEGLNIPCGIAVGHGGVWVSNAPDILFLQDTNGDGKADKREVVVTGFGRSDTHELPNSLTWGPDGWLYGLNGVFNRSHVKQGDKEFRFDVAMFRIHPKTREFQLFAEGTSNPWGIAFDPLGGCFISACVIDHLWHISETGYYHRQAGAYPPHTWKIESIVKHKHQKAAYCGLEYFDSDAYPEQYRDRLMMGNIHGGCVNVDKLQRRGSSYFATGEPDFLTANDVWFMPIDQKTGPDGSLYVLDWYDRYHCYQDANRDPKGVDRLHGRLYRVRYQQTPRAKPFDLAQESDDQLIARLASPNIYFRATAQRILQERDLGAATRAKLEQAVLDESKPQKPRMHALFSLVGSGDLPAAFHRQLLANSDPDLRAWGVRAAGNQGEVAADLLKTIEALATDEAPQVRQQVAVAANKLSGAPAASLLAAVMQTGDDAHLDRIVWQNLQPHLDEPVAAQWVAHLADQALSPGVRRTMPHLIDRVLAHDTDDPRGVVQLFELVTSGPSRDPDSARRLLDALTKLQQTKQIPPQRVAQWREALSSPVIAWLKQEEQEQLKQQGELFASAWDIKPLEGDLRAIFLDKKQPNETRLKALAILLRTAEGKDWLGEQAAADEGELIDLLAASDADDGEFQHGIVDQLGEIPAVEVGRVVLAAYPHASNELRGRMVGVLASRDTWGGQLLASVASEKIDRHALNANQLRALAASGDPQVRAAVKELFGEIRTTRDPDREQALVAISETLAKTSGDAHRGLAVYRKLCGQCHKLHGEGQEVGPDITVNGRASFEQLLSNVFDPNLVIGADYQSRTVITTEGQILTGLVVEDTPRRIVLKIEGGKQEIVPRDQVDEMVVNELSLMPEGVEKQLTPQELADLMALLTLDKAPSDPEAKQIPGTPPALHRQ